MRIPFAIIMVTTKMIIMNPMEAHLLSSPSTESKMKVAAAPATTANPTLSQNRMFSLLSFSPCCAGLMNSSPGASSGGASFVAGISATGGVCPVSLSGSVTMSSFGDSASSLPFVGADFFFLNLANEISIVIGLGLV